MVTEAKVPEAAPPERAAARTRKQEPQTGHARKQQVPLFNAITTASPQRNDFSDQVRRPHDGALADGQSFPGDKGHVWLDRSMG